MYEFFEHTADLGLRVVADDLDTLFADAGAGLFAMIQGTGDDGTDSGGADAGDPRGDPADAADPVRELEFRIRGDRLDHLLFDWLNELLYTFDTSGVLLSGFRVSVAGEGLVARAEARPFDLRAAESGREVKAITYHGLRVERRDDGWVAEVIVDI